MTRRLSNQSIEALALVITGGSAFARAEETPGKYRSAWHLEEFFKGIGVSFAVQGCSRVSAVRGCLEALNTSEPGKLDEAIHAVCDSRDYLDKEADLQAVVAYLNKRFRFDDLELRKQGEFYKLASMSAGGLPASGLRELVGLTNYESVRADFERSIATAEHDPADAITSASSIVESVCKCILDEMEQPYPSKQDIKGLVSEVGKHLNLSPARDDFPTHLAHDIKQILSGLINVSSGIGALRTHGGDAHGRGRNTVPVDARIARLAIHAASTVSLFYIETWKRVKGGM